MKPLDFTSALFRPIPFLQPFAAVWQRRARLPASASTTLHLLGDQPIHTMQLASGVHMLLQGVAGCAWVTLDGHPTDHFLFSGAQLVARGPARLRIGAADGADAQLRCQVVQPCSGTRS